MPNNRAQVVKWLEERKGVVAPPNREDETCQIVKRLQANGIDMTETEVKRRVWLVLKKTASIMQQKQLIDGDANKNLQMMQHILKEQHNRSRKGGLRSDHSDLIFWSAMNALGSRRFEGFSRGWMEELASAEERQVAGHKSTT